MAKKLIVSFDGTWNTPDDDADLSGQVETNARRLYESVLITPTQLKWYDQGVGTKWYDHVRGGTFGLGLDKNIKQGYEFLIENHEEGNEVYVFGFSRGAYTARSLVGLIRNCGLLKKAHRKRLDAAYEIYRTRDEGADSETATFFRGEFAKEIRIKFLGVWDTVGALGIPLESFRWFNKRRYEFHDTELSGIVENAYHAVAVDEHREAYVVTLWNPKAKPQQVMEQRWFLGAHSDVGGGYADRRLSDITLRWMQEKVQAVGLELDPPHLPQVTDNYQVPLTDSYQRFLKGAYSRLHARFYRGVRQTTNGNEVVDDTVELRRQSNLNYRPKNHGL